MRIKDFEVSKVIGLDVNTRDLLNLFCGYMDITSSELTNKLYRQWFFNSLATLEDQHPDQWEHWQDLRQLLHSK